MSPLATPHIHATGENHLSLVVKILLGKERIAPIKTPTNLRCWLVYVSSRKRKRSALKAAAAHEGGPSEWKREHFLHQSADDLIWVLRRRYGGSKPVQSEKSQFGLFPACSEASEPAPTVGGGDSSALQESN